MKVVNCCENCFYDQEIKDIIKSHKNLGSCEFCGSKLSYVYEASLLSDFFEDLINIYSPAAEIENEAAKDSQLYLQDALAQHWRIFNLEPGKIQKLISNIFKDRNQEIQDLLTLPVVIPAAFDSEYLLNHSFLNNKLWEDFVNEIKYINRFHIENKVNLDILDKFISYFIKTYKKGDTFFRARLTESNVPLSPMEMGAPPKKKCSAGRANPKGISVLYLSNDKDTTVVESKARLFDYLTIGTFNLLDDLSIISFRLLDTISPFKLDDITEYAVNKTNLTKISREIAKPLRRSDSDLDYLPTQYLTEYIKSKGYDGIEYLSTVRPSGYNLAIFNKSKLKCTKSELYEIKDINYSFELVEQSN